MKKPKLKPKANSDKPKEAELHEGNDAANRFKAGMARLLAGSTHPKSK